jgi:hypothetical protein
MRKIILAVAGLAAAAIIPAAGASAQYHGRGNHYGHYDRDVARELRECRRELRRADNRWEYRRELRECRREIARERWEDRYDRRYRGYRGYGSRGW